MSKKRHKRGFEQEKPKEEAGKKEEKEGAQTKGILIAAIIFSAVLLIVGAYMLIQVNNAINSIGSIPNNPPVLEPGNQNNVIQEKPEIEVIQLAASSCAECPKLDSFVNALKQLDVNVTKDTLFEFDSTKGEQLVKDFNITRVPTVIISGGIDDANIVSLLQDYGEKVNGSFVVRNAGIPYFDLKDLKVKGIVDATILRKESCTECFDMNATFIELLKSSGVYFRNVNFVDSNSSEGLSLTSNYSFKTLPVMILSPELKEYSSLIQNWSNVGFVDGNGFYVLDKIFPPYYDLNSNSVEGLVEVTYLVDEKCTDCYSPKEVHGPILERLLVKVSKETFIDVNSTQGKELIAKYKIKEIPTMILSPEAKYYDSLNGVWDTVGSIEADGFYVFRDVNSLSVKFVSLK
ncbi:MAG: hypothetical protein AB1467_04955 [Candidatus Diapherotrites archaeon]